MQNTWITADAADVHTMCGPRFNTFAPAKREPEQPGGFFRPGTEPTDRHHDEDPERFDGLA